MRVRIADEAALRAVRPLDVIAYLRSRGWKELEDETDFSVWVLAREGDGVDALAPKHQGWRDYHKRIQELIELLGEVESRSQLSILRDITEVTSDIVRLRADTAKLSDGTIPLGDGLKLTSSVRAMLQASACAADTPRRAHHTRKPAKVGKYLDTLRMGQSERGSYILTVLSPVSPALKTGQLGLPGTEEPAEVPFSRKVTRVLATALPLVVSGAERAIATGSLESFEQAVEKGVSADLCEALALLRNAQQVEAVDVSVGWAPTRPDETVAGVVTIREDLLEVVAEAGRLLREKDPMEDFVLVGPVLKIDRKEDEHSGTISVLGAIGDKPRKIRVTLSGDDWKKAHEALGDTNKLLRCEGDLLKRGRSFELLGPRRISVISSDDLDADDES